nr:molecular chaperone DnaK [Streptococcus thermophilus]
MSKDWTLSIDFGTSNTAAAHTNPTRGGVEAVSLSHDRMTMPSSVYIENPEHVETGDVALNKAEGNPDGFLAAPKRVIPQQIFQINGYDIPASTPVAAVLESVVRRASREHNDHRPAELVLTHPEAWTDAEIKVLLDAATQLGLNATTIRTVSEPKAAAQYYSANQPLEPGDKIAVFDFGGGTLDVAVLEAQNDGSFHIVAARGDNSLGGKSFDALIRRWVDRQLEDDHPDQIEYLRRRAPLSDRHAVEDSIRRAKEVLSESPTATITVPGESESVRLTLTRSEFEDIIRQPVQRATDLTRQTLIDAGVTSPGDLKALYMTGGSSRVPMVQEEIKSLGPVANLDDPKMVVAQGALSAVAPIVTGLHTSTAPTTPTYAGQPGPAGRPGHFGQPGQYSPPTQVQPVPPHTGQPGQPGQSGQPQPQPGKKNRTALAVGAVLGSVLLIGGIGAFALTRGGDDPAENQAQGGQTAAESAGESTTPAPTESEEPKTGEEIYAALPEKLQESVESCSLNSSSAGLLGAPSIQCKVKVNSEGVEHFREVGRYASSFMNLAVNKDAAKRERSLIKQGRYSKSEEGITEESSDGTAGVGADTSNLYDAEVTYADTETGLVLSSYDFASPQDAVDWLKTHELL